MSDTNGTQEQQKAAKIRRKLQQESILQPTFAATRRDTSGALWDRQQQESGLLQRQCACGTHTVGGGECNACRKKRESSFLQRTAANVVPDDVILNDPAETYTFPKLGFTRDFSQIPVHSPTPTEVQNHSLFSIPPQGIEDDEIIDTPRFVITPISTEAPHGGGPAEEPVESRTLQANGADSCGEPLSMTKVISGPFQGGLTMDDYYPDLSGRGFWQHGGTAGPWDTGSRAGVNVQLFGTVPSPCRPDQFHLEQTVTREKERINGIATAREGTSSDDIAQSGRDASQAPFRQMWLGGGLNISMADPPSGPYSATQDIEYKKHFVTALRGPDGRRSVNWTIELKTENGRVTQNTVT